MESTTTDEQTNKDPLGGMPVNTSNFPITVQQPGTANQRQQPKRGLVDSYLLLVPFGWFGAHHFYLRRPIWGVIYIFTVGLFGFGYIADFFRLPSLVKKSNRKAAGTLKEVDDKSLLEAYMLWFICGFFGFHHFYLRNKCWGFVYLFTMGLCGLGWLMDAFCMPRMLKEYREQRHREETTVSVFPEGATFEASHLTNTPRKSLVTAYRLCLFPVTGLFGAHHFYLGRIEFGIFQIFTCGGFGIGWVIDWIRLSWLVNDVNQNVQNRGKQTQFFSERRLDDCYLLAIPFGIFGAHNFYLRRIGWGCLYLFTCGLFGVGWIVDLCRMGRLLAIYNVEMKARRNQLSTYSTGHVNAGSSNDVPQAYIPSPSAGFPGQQVQTISPGTYAITPAPPYSVVPGVHPPTLPQYPPNPGATNYSCLFTRASSDDDGPPSYEASILQQNEVQQNAVNEHKVIT